MVDAPEKSAGNVLIVPTVLERCKVGVKMSCGPLPLGSCTCVARVSEDV